MSAPLLAWRGLRYNAGSHLATALGIGVAAMVLAGALLVGDSLRASLRERAMGRLGWIDSLLVAGRPFGQDLAASADGNATPAFLLTATLEIPAAGEQAAQEINHVTLMGVEDSFFGTAPPADWPAEGLWLGDDFSDSRLQSGGRVVLRVGKPGNGPPRESLLGAQAAEQSILRWELPIRGLIPAPMSGFAPRPTLAPARLVVVPLALLQARLNLPGRANALLARGEAASLNARLTKKLRVADFGLTLRGPAGRAHEQIRQAKAGRNPLTRALPRLVATEALLAGSDDENMLLEKWYRTNRPFALVESSGMYLTAMEEAAVLESAKALGLKTARVLVHLANRIEVGGKRVPYSVVAAVDPVGAPLIPELPGLGTDGITLVDYKGAPWAGLQPGAQVSLSYYPVEDTTPPREAPPSHFRLTQVIPQQGIATDAELAPAFPGITDKLDMGSWQAPFPIDLKAISQVDEAYWRDYRSAPKAFVSLAAGQALWGGRFGTLSSIRLVDPSGRPPEAWLAELEAGMLARLDPAAAGLAFLPAREQAITASAGSSDFGGLFLGFSSFLMASGLLLSWLLLSLGLQRRRHELGILAATGWRPAAIRRVFILELAVVTALGALVGALGGAWLAPWLISVLLDAWPDPSLGRMLRPVVNPVSLLIGALGAWLAGMSAAWFSVRGITNEAPLFLLQGAEASPKLNLGPRTPFISLGLLGLGIILLVVSPFLPPGEPRAGGFFTAGLSLLSAGLGLFRYTLGLTRSLPIQGGGSRPFGRLALRSAARNPGRSLLTMGLLAFASFLLVAVEVFRRQAPGAGDGSIAGPLGGIDLWVELDLPIYQRPVNSDGRLDWLDAVERAHGDNPALARSRRAQAGELFGRCQFFPMRLAGQEDAGCLNLYQPGTPRVLGAPDELMREGGFQFAASMQPGDPWQPLLDSGSPPWVLGEAAAVQWILKSSLGGEIALGEGRKARLAGMLHDSPFQSELVTGDTAFRLLFPGQEGWRVLLVRCPPGEQEEVAKFLQVALGGHGAEVEATRLRVARALGVENTYLTVFQALGGLGLVLGTAGLGVVLLRGVWERRKELALLQAIGFRRGDLATLLLMETLVLLLGGLGLGVVCALAAVLPHAMGLMGHWPGLLLQVSFCLGSGLFAGAVACRAALRVPVLQGLRSE